MSRACSTLRQRGVAAVELAFLMTVIFMFLSSALLIARSLMQATVVQRAADNAAHMISTYPQYLRRDPTVDLNQEAVDMVNEAALAGGLSASAISGVGSYCPGRVSCTDKIAPTEVGLAVSADVLSPGTLLPSISTVSLAVSSSDRYAN